MINLEYQLASKIVTIADNKLRLSEKEQQECLKVITPAIREIRNDILCEIFGSYAFLCDTPLKRQNAKDWWDCKKN